MAKSPSKNKSLTSDGDKPNVDGKRGDTMRTSTATTTISGKLLAFALELDDDAGDAGSTRPYNTGADLDGVESLPMLSIDELDS